MIIIGNSLDELPFTIIIYRRMEIDRKLIKTTFQVQEFFAIRPITFSPFDCAWRVYP